MRQALAAIKIAEFAATLDDVFQGDPSSDHEKRVDALRVSLETVRDNFDRYGLLDEQVIFLKGWFKDMLAQAPTDKIAVPRLDGDMYESTWQALTALYPKLSPGGFIIVDDYNCIPGCKAAVTDFRKLHHIDAPISEVDWTGAFWRRV